MSEAPATALEKLSFAEESLTGEKRISNKYARRIFFAVDGSDYSRACIEWAVDHRVMDEYDEIHLIHVIPDVNPDFAYTTMFDGDVLMYDYTDQEFNEKMQVEVEAAKASAIELLGQYADIIKSRIAHVLLTGYAPVAEETPLKSHGDPLSTSAGLKTSIITPPAAHKHEHASSGINIVKHILSQTGVSPERGICNFVNKNESNIDMLVMGWRGQGILKSALLGFVGMGSVTDFVMRHVNVPVIVIRVPKKMMAGFGDDESTSKSAEKLLSK